MPNDTNTLAHEPAGQEPSYPAIYQKKNLVAWCIVPYDLRDRTPAQRASMLRDLGIRRMAWDWRERHLSQLEEEIYALRDAEIELTSVWFWLDNRASLASDGLLDHHEKILQTLDRTNTKTTLWVSYDNDFYAGLTDEQRLRKAVKSVGNILSRAKAQGLRVALYNHGDWFGEPENQIRILRELGVEAGEMHGAGEMPGAGEMQAAEAVQGSITSADIGLVYNFHHGHEQTEQFPQLLNAMLPHLWTVNINGMKRGGEKIMDINAGDLEQEMLATLAGSGFRGTIGILGHTEGEDVRDVLERNLRGLHTWAQNAGHNTKNP